MQEAETSPVDVEDTSDEEILDVDSEVETEETEAELDDDGNPIEEPDEIDEEEVELDDLKLKLPREQAAKVREAMLRQADYTRKTQEVAEQRKAILAERQSMQNATNAEISVLARAQSVDQELAKYADVDWDTWYSQDPQNAQVAESRFNRLTRERGEALNQFSQMKQQRAAHEQQETARLIEEGRQVLARDIKGWSTSLATELVETGVKEYGFNRDEIEEFTDPRMVKVLHDAYQFRKAQTKDKAVRSHTAAQQVKPAERVRARTAPPKGLDDNLSVEEWAKRREAQLRKRG